MCMMPTSSRNPRRQNDFNCEQNNSICRYRLHRSSGEYTHTRSATSAHDHRSAGSDGQTHSENVEIKFSATTLYRKAEASEAVKVSEAQFFRLPKGEVQNWHKPARRQYVVTLSGRGEVEIAGGQ